MRGGFLLGSALLAGCGDVCDRAGVICTVAGVGGTLGFNGDGEPALETWMYQPSALAVRPDDGQLVIDDFNNMRIRVLDEVGSLTTIVGNGVHSYATVGLPALESALENPIDIAYAPDGTLYIAELHGMRVLKVDSDGIMEPVCGVVGEPGFNGDDQTATATWFNNVSSVTVDEAGLLYTADTANHLLRTVDAEGVVRTVAGEPLVFGFVDGAGGAARFNLPQRVRYHDGSVWVADTFNHAVRRYDVETGEVVTIAGTGVAGFSGDGGPGTSAQLNMPYGVQPDDEGGAWIADSMNHRVRYVDAGGEISTVVGDGQRAFGGDGGFAVEAQLNVPSDVLPDGQGGFWLTDMFNGAVRHVAGGR